MPARTSRNNILAGLFVIVSVAVGVATTIALSDAVDALTPVNKYVVNFSLTNGAAGLEPGSVVKLGGQRVGSVSAVRFARDASSAEPVGIEVDIRIRKDIVLYENAPVLLELPLLGGFSALNIPSIGDPTLIQTPRGSSPRAESGEILAGFIAPPSFLDQAGYGPEQRTALKKLIENATAASEKLNRIVTNIESNLEPTTQKVQKILDDAASMTDSAAQAWPRWEARVDSTLANVDDASEKFKPIVDDAAGLVSDARAVVTDFQATLDAEQSKVTSILDNINELSAKLNTETYASLQGVMTDAGEVIDRFVAALDEATTLIRTESPQIREIMANGRLASDQLKLTMTELRAAPWKLLAAPSGRKELENEVLYDSARQYVAAVADLKAAAASLESLTRSSGAAPAGSPDRRSMEMIAAELQQSLERYRNAEEAFFGRLIQSNP